MTKIVIPDEVYEEAMAEYRQREEQVTIDAGAFLAQLEEVREGNIDVEDIKPSKFGNTGIVTGRASSANAREIANRK